MRKPRERASVPENRRALLLRSALLGQHARGTRDLKEVEVYSKLHYESKVKPLVSDALKNNPVQPTQRLSAVQQHTTDCFVDESDEVKKEIREETDRIREQKKKFISQIFEDLSVLTGGWHYTLLMGRVDPLCEGDIMTLSYHHSKTADGLSFKACTPNFHEQYLSPFEQHLGRIYGASSKSTLPVAPSSTPTSPRLPPGLISLEYESTSPHLPPGLISLEDESTSPHLPPGLISLENESTSPRLPPGLISLEDESSVGNVLDPSLDFNALAGTKEHGEWSMRTDLNPITSPHNTTDTPITAWRKSTAFNEDPLTTFPTFNRTQWPGVSMADPSVEAIPPLMFHLLLSFHTALLPQPASLLAQQMNQFSALEEVNGLSMEPHGNPLLFTQPMFNLGLHAPPDTHIPLSLLTTITLSLLPTSTPPESIHFKSTKHQPPSAPHQPSSIDQGSSAASRQLSPCDIGGVLAGETLQPGLETGTVSLLPVVSAASNRRTKRPPCPSMRAAEANKIGVKQGTKPAPKRKQTEVQRNVWKPMEAMALINKGIQDVWSQAFRYLLTLDVLFKSSHIVGLAFTTRLAICLKDMGFNPQPRLARIEAGGKPALQNISTCIAMLIHSEIMELRSR
ncbi:hypothetical protein EV424DRAFT_1560109 [Suillus variegatus]|nr:hypothetical protein EV424DRAFT_1560109 [Suillus variegatus]